MTKSAKNFSRYPTKFVELSHYDSSDITVLVGHLIRHCGNRVIMVLVCHVILQDHAIKGSCNFMGRSS